MQIIHLHLHLTYQLLPPAYVVRREGNSFTLFVSSHLRGGYPYPIMLCICQNSQNAMGQLGGYPARSSQGGYPGGGVPWQGVPWWGVPWPGVVPWPGGYPGWGGTLAGGYPGWGGYPGQGGTLARGGTQLGQHMEYLLHGGQYASCVHRRRTFLFHLCFGILKR